jgi:hypothetical protein
MSLGQEKLEITFYFINYEKDTDQLKNQPIFWEITPFVANNIITTW